MGSTVGARAVSTVATLVLTYFIDPDVMGEFAIVHVITINAHYLSNFGVDRYVVSYPKSGRDYAFQATLLHLASGALALGLVLFFREPLSRFAGGTALAISFVPGMVLAVAFERLGQMPEKILTREMRFRAISLGRTAGELFYAGVAVVLAIEGWGGMALVLANIVRSAIQAFSFIFAAETKEWLQPCALNKEHYKKMLDFGVPLSLGAIFNLVSRTWDNALVGRLFGPASLGFYKQAYNFADIPAIQIGETVGDVLLPSFANMDDVEHRRAALLRATGLLVLVMAPMAIGLGAVSDTLVKVLLREEWYPIAPLLTVLSAMAVFRPIGWTYGTFLQSEGKTKVIFFLEIFKTIAVLGALLLLAKVSLLWACAGVGVGFALETLAAMWAVSKTDDIPILKSLVAMIGPLVACIPMVAAVLGVRYLCLEVLSLPLWVSLCAEIGSGAIVFVVAGLVLPVRLRWTL